MNERIRILNMVRDGKLTVDEAEKLLDALYQKAVGGQDTVSFKDKRGRKHKKVHVQFDAGDNGGQTKLNVGIPIGLVRSFGPLLLHNLPKEAKQEMDRCGITPAQFLEDIDKTTRDASDDDIVRFSADGEDPANIQVTVDHDGA